MSHRPLIWSIAALAVLWLPTADAQPNPFPGYGGGAPPVRTSMGAGSVTLGGYVETFYNYNFNDPDNGVNNFRGFDNRHGTFTLGNAVISARLDQGPAYAYTALQWGHTALSYHQERTAPQGPGTGPSDATTWRNLQESYVGWAVPDSGGLVLEAGVFLSPIGFESLAVNQNWHWSNSNLYYGLPFYHTGVRATRPLSDSLTLTLALYNGWNTIVDNNDAKSPMVSLAWEGPGGVESTLLYFGSMEADEGADERPWRHLFDVTLKVPLGSRLTFGGQADFGFESVEAGTSSWTAVAGYLHLKATDRWAFSVRGDWFGESPADLDDGTQRRLLWPVDSMMEGTFTISFHATSNLLMRLEYRYDQASDPLFYDGDDPETTPSADTQQTVLFGVTAWL